MQMAAIDEKRTDLLAANHLPGGSNGSPDRRFFLPFVVYKRDLKEHFGRRLDMIVITHIVYILQVSEGLVRWLPRLGKSQNCLNLTTFHK